MENADDSGSAHLISSSQSSFSRSFSGDFWTHSQKHYFILSRSGKPVYSWPESEDRSVTIMGIMQALVSFVENQNNEIQSLIAGQHKCVFMTTKHLILVVVSRKEESLCQLKQQLECIYNQVLSMLPSSMLDKAFRDPAYDLRRLLRDVDRLLAKLIDSMNNRCDFGRFLEAISCVRLPSALRDNLLHTLSGCVSKIDGLVYVVVIFERQLVSYFQIKSYPLHPGDYHLLINMIESSPSLRTITSWIPICLPHLDNSGFLHAHVSFPDPDSEIGLFLLTLKDTGFDTLSQCQAAIMERFGVQNLWKQLAEHLPRPSNTVGVNSVVGEGDTASMSGGIAHDHPFCPDSGYDASDTGVDNLYHFVYCYGPLNQVTYCRFGPPYRSGVAARARLLDCYRQANGLIRSQSDEHPVKLTFMCTDSEAILGWKRPGDFELYAAFSPFVTREQATLCMEKLLKWIKRERSSLFATPGTLVQT